MAKVGVRFGKLEFKCRHLFDSPIFDSPEHAARIVHFFGIPGDVEIGGGATSRLVRIRMWIYDEKWNDVGGSKDLQKELTKYEQAIGDHGKLTYVPLATLDEIELENCTLKSVERDNQTGPRLDETGMLGGRENNGTIKKVWWQEITVTWRQLLV